MKRVLLAVPLLAFSACAGLQVRPERTTDVPRAASPVNKRLGLRFSVIEGEGVWDPVEVSKAMMKTAGRANLFRAVDFADGREDLVLEAELKGRTIPEPVGMLILKGITAGATLCLLCPVFRTHHAAQLAVEAFVRDREGRELARYTVYKEAKAVSNMFGELEVKYASEASVAEQVVAELTAKLAADRESWGTAAPAAPAVQRAPAKESVDEPSYSSKPRPADYALVVGIEDYPGLPKAKHAQRDAQAVRAHLKALGVPERNVVSLTGAGATRGKLAAYLDEWLPKNVKPESRVYFYYSGHGAPDPKTGQAYLVPSDGDPMFLQSTAFPLKDVYAKLAKLPAKQVVVALDACFSGAGGRSVLAEGARPLVTKSESLSPSGRLSVLAAASGDEITGGLDDAGHGMFTYYFLKGLSAGKRSTRELHEYLKPQVQDEARRQNREQTPVLLGQDLEL